MKLQNINLLASLVSNLGQKVETKIPVGKHSREKVDSSRAKFILATEA